MNDEVSQQVMTEDMKKINLTMTATQREVLRIITKRTTNPQRLVMRAGILLDYDQRGSQVEVATQRQVNRKMVARWLTRWSQATETLEKREQAYQEKQLKLTAYEREIEQVLTDAPRPGTPPRITEAQKQQMLAMAAQSPEQVGIPLTNWSHQTLAKVVVAKQIVPQISPSHLGRLLKKSDLTTAPKPVLGTSQQ
jgi:putative transposase